MRRQSASVTGASIPARPSARASRGTDSSASTAWPICWGMSAAGTPSASSSPARRLRLWGARAVATRSPVPASPISDSGRAPCISAKRQTSAKMCPAAAPAAFSPWASVAPAARAAAFLAAPASSTPTGSFDTSHTTPASVNIARQRFRQPLVGRGGHEPRSLGHHLVCVRGAADAGDALGAELLAQQDGGRGAVGRHETLGQRHHRRARAETRLGQPGDDLVEPARGDAEEHIVGAGQPRGDRLDPQLSRKRDLGQVLGVRSLLGHPFGLLGRAGLERRAHPPSRQQHRHRRPERPGADDDGAAIAGALGHGRERIGKEMPAGV